MMAAIRPQFTGDPVEDCFATVVGEVECATGSSSAEISSSISVGSLAGAAAAPDPTLMPESGLPVASAACLSAVAMVSAMGLEVVCQAYCLAEGVTTSEAMVLFASGSDMDSSSAASAGSGAGVGSFSSSNAELDEAITAGASGGAA